MSDREIRLYLQSHRHTQKYRPPLEQCITHRDSFSALLVILEGSLLPILIAHQNGCSDIRHAMTLVWQCRKMIVSGIYWICWLTVLFELVPKHGIILLRL
jgi:hypothetical protein